MSSANYGDIGEQAFLAIAEIIKNSDVCEIIYPTLEDAVELVDEFVSNHGDSKHG